MGQLRAYWLGQAVSLLSYFFFGVCATNAQGIYFENNSPSAVNVTVDKWIMYTDGNSEDEQYTFALDPGEFYFLDGNIFYDDFANQQGGTTNTALSYSWYVQPLLDGYYGYAGGQIGLSDLVTHYATFGQVARISATRGNDEFSVGRAVITNTSANTYQFQGQTIDPFTTQAFITPSNTLMWNSVWEEVARFGSSVMQPNHLQFQTTALAPADNYRALDWQEKMMWWSGPSDPMQWAWYEWDGQTFNFSGVEIEGTVPQGSTVAAPPVSPVEPNWPQIMTGNGTPPVMFTPVGGNNGGGGNGGGGNGGGGNGGGGNGGGGNGGVFIELPDDYAREPTLQLVQEDTAKIRQHTWGTNQRLDDIKLQLDGLDPMLPANAGPQAQQQHNDNANAQAGEMQNQMDGVNGALDGWADDVADNEGWGFFDVLFNNVQAGMNGGFAPVQFELAGQQVIISPHHGVWSTFLPWMKGILALGVFCFFVFKLHQAFKEYYQALLQTSPVISNMHVTVAGTGARGLTTVSNLGIQWVAITLFMSFFIYVGVAFAATECFTNIAMWMQTAFDTTHTGTIQGTVEGAPTYNWLAITLDWAFASLPIVCAAQLLVMYYGITASMMSAYTSAVMVFKTGSM